MTNYNCRCGKSFKHKIPARRHLESSHKGEILRSEVQMLDTSLKCGYCDKYIRDSADPFIFSYKKNYNSMVL